MLDLPPSPQLLRVSRRPPYDYVLMFKILILQRYYNLSDDQIEFQIMLWIILIGGIVGGGILGKDSDYTVFGGIAAFIVIIFTIVATPGK